jgi:amidase
MEARFGIIEQLALAPLGSGPLDGTTFAVKDLFAIKGRVCGFGSPDWQASHAPDRRNAPVIDLLRSAGASLEYVTVSDELALSLDGLNTHYPLPINMQSPDRICGGSSSGSASACAHELVDFALGTDTAGSVRVPAAYCGLYGLRPTHGAISAEGVLPLGPRFDTVGVMTRDAKMLERVTSVLLPQFGRDCGVQETMFVDNHMLSLLDQRLGLRCEETIDRFAQHFKQVRRDDFGFDLAAYANHYAVMRGYESWQRHGLWWQEYKPKLLAGTHERFVAGSKVTQAEYEQSLKAYKLVRQKMRDFFVSGGVIFTPTVWTYAPLLTASAEELASNRQRNILLTALSFFAGLPQLTIPVKIEADSRYPATFGFSLIGNYGSDLALTKLACQLS